MADSSSWFVKPDTLRLDLPGQQWIEIKSRLTVGDEKRMQTGAFTDLKPTGDGQHNAVGVDWARYAFARVEAYVVDWSLTDADGRHVDFSRSAVEALEPDRFQLIDDALSAHLEKREQEKKVEASGKKKTGKASSPSATSSA